MTRYVGAVSTAIATIEILVLFIDLRSLGSR